MRVQKLNKSKKLALIPFLLLITISLTALLFLNACNADNELNNKTKENQTEPGNKSTQTTLPKVLAVESFLADITKNVSGTRLEIDTLMPLGLDPHSFEPSPGDVAKITESDILIINGAGFEEWLEDIITGANEKIIIVECSKGLKGDPHFWLDPNLVKVYVQNIRDALIESDPQGKDLYNKNAEEYTARLIELDKWIAEAVKKIPEDKRLLVTNHESFGYYADRYGFKVIGTIIPGSSSASSPSAKEISELIEKIKATGAKAIFLETGSDPKIANQIARETNIKIVTELYTHSITEPDGPAPTYIDMIEFNTKEIVESLK
ncbi:MAG: zinc ABC transporter substrate-binding protein [Candidatus Atribacteria bacterium]|nr:zinc ABC transporter substrate-binding protein [Candidatus Atribacteria bacterium]